MSSNRCTIKPRVGVGSLSSPLEVGADRSPQAAKDLAKLLTGLGCEVIELGPVDSPDKSRAAGRKLVESHVHAVAFASTSWFEDYLVLDLLEECPLPVLLWSLPGMETGALCGTQQLTAYLKSLDVVYSCVYGSFDLPELRSKTKAFLTAASLKHKLRRAKVGFGGYRVVGMTEVAANEFALKKAIGPRIVNIDMPLLLESVKQMPDERAGELWSDVVSKSAKCEVTESDGRDSMKVYLALRKIIEDSRLDALTIGCYPHFMGKVCLAASLLADEGVPMACEGDVNGAVGQFILTLLSGEPTHNTDWLEPLEDGTVVFSHCGSGSFSLAENPKDITLRPVRLMNQGVCALFPSRPGPVTLLSLIPSDEGYQIAMLEGEAISTEMVFPGNPLRVQFDTPTNEIIDWIYSEGIGHHWMAGYGSFCEEIRQWVKLAGPSLRLVELS